jgi:hypothetical protein
MKKGKFRELDCETCFIGKRPKGRVKLIIWKGAGRRLYADDGNLYVNSVIVRTTAEELVLDIFSGSGSNGVSFLMKRTLNIDGRFLR